MSKDTSEPEPRSPLAAGLLAAVLSAIVGFAAVYVTLGRPDNVERPAQAVSPAVPARSDTGKRNTGRMTAFVYRKAPEALPEASFVDGAGQPMTLQDLRGKTVLLNLWATWCAPCREEMPALDRLQRDLGSDTFEVVAVSVDRAGIEAARKFLNDVKVANLKLYADPTARLAVTLKVVGMPATLLIDSEGREIGRLVGPAEWDSADAKRLIEAAVR